MIDAGKLRIILSCSEEKVEQVDIHSTRPLHITRLLTGKTPEKVLATIPLVFNVCGIAQAFAALTACSKALELYENTQSTTARQLLLNVEIVREHCWWLLIKRDKAALAPFVQLLEPFKQAVFTKGDAFSLKSQLQIQGNTLENLINFLEQAVNLLFGGQRSSFLTVGNIEDLQLWLETGSSIPAKLLQELLEHKFHSLGRSSLCLLPVLSDAELLSHLWQQNADEFSRHPSWQGVCHETSSLNRTRQHPFIAYLLRSYGNGVLTRLSSRLIELASMPDLLRQNFIDLTLSDPFLPVSFKSSENSTSAFANSMGIHVKQPPLSCGTESVSALTGIAQIQASRGLLIHRVELERGLVSHYQIVAPTEWNFQSRGIAALSLKVLDLKNEISLQQQATLVINSIDPCVNYEIQIA